MAWQASALARAISCATCGSYEVHIALNHDTQLGLILTLKVERFDKWFVE
jgi:hypothetical protein